MFPSNNSDSSDVTFVNQVLSQYPSIDTSQIYFNAHKTMAPNRGWQWDCNTFFVIFHVRCSWLLKQIREVSIASDAVDIEPTTKVLRKSRPSQWESYACYGCTSILYSLIIWLKILLNKQLEIMLQWDGFNSLHFVNRINMLF